MNRKGNNVEPENDRAVGVSAHDGSNSIDALDILLALSSRRRLIGAVTLVALLLGILAAVLLKPNFMATAIIMPPQQQSSASSLMGQLGSLAALGGGSSIGGSSLGSSLGMKSQADMYVGILESRTIADELISRFHLESEYHRKNLTDTRAALKNASKFEVAKDGLIHIAVTDHDPNRASDLANAYVNDLYGMNADLAVAEASQRKIFFDQQLDSEKKALTDAEDDLRATEQKTGIIQLSGQAAVTIRSIAELRAEIDSREVELQSMHTFATDENPHVTRLQEEIATMRAQLAKLENDEQRQEQPGNISLPAGRVPEDTLVYARKLREVKYHETLYDLLAKQFEAARIDQAKSAPIIQVIDHAIPPDKRSGPHRSWILAGALLSGFLISSMYVLFTYSYHRIETAPDSAQKMKELRAIWRSPRS